MLFYMFKNFSHRFELCKIFLSGYISRINIRKHQAQIILQQGKLIMNISIILVVYTFLVNIKSKFSYDSPTVISLTHSYTKIYFKKV